MNSKASAYSYYCGTTDFEAIVHYANNLASVDAGSIAGHNIEATDCIDPFEQRAKSCGLTLDGDFARMLTANQLEHDEREGTLIYYVTSYSVPVMWVYLKHENGSYAKHIGFTPSGQRGMSKTMSKHINGLRKAQLEYDDMQARANKIIEGVR